LGRVGNSVQTDLHTSHQVNVMSKKLYIHERLLGGTLRSVRGEKHTIVAAWLEKCEGREGLQVTVMGIGSMGECRKFLLPDPDLELTLKGS
jgi:hypothetical protein